MRLIPVPRGMSDGFYAFMGAGCIRSPSGEMMMIAPDNTVAPQTGQDWRIGLACTPKMRSHPWYGHMGVTRRIFPATANMKEHMHVEIYCPGNDLVGLDEPTDEWMSA